MNMTAWLRAQWDRVGAVLCVVGGLFALLLGWLGLSDVGLPAAQIPYLLSGGFLGLVLVGIGATLWMSADMRDEWRKLDSLEEIGARLLEGADVTPAAPVTLPAEREPDTASPRNGRRRLSAPAASS